MKVNYTSFLDNEKQFNLLNGIYPIEQDASSRWIWTAQNFGGTIDNIEYITFSLISNIKNQLIYDDKIIDIDKDCLYIIKVITKNKTHFNFSLKTSYEDNNDQRLLGIMLVGIKVEEDVIF